jgi:hypothetical protein
MKFLFLLFPLLALSAEAATTKTETNSAAPLGRDLVLFVKHEKLVPECREDAGEFVQSILQMLSRKGYTVHLAREFVSAECDYYRANATNEVSPATAQAVRACLEDSLRRNWLDWDCLRAVHRAAPDSAAVMRHFPWLQIPRDSSEVQLAATTNSLPVLELNLRWEGVAVRGIAALGTSRFGGVPLSDYTPTYTGTTYLWNPSATLRLLHGEATVFEQSYPGEARRKQYINKTDLPSYRTNWKILDDLQRELRPAGASAPSGAKLKKKRA